MAHPADTNIEGKKRSALGRFFKGPEDPPVAWFDNLQVFSGGRIGAMSGDYAGKRSAAGFTIELGDGETLSKRVTLTRVLAIGVFALAAKKKSGGERWLAVEGPDAEWLLEVPDKKLGDAQKFMHAFRKAIRDAEAT